ncbi:hypothetical protein BGW39_008633 [Mortierella sp. 14UC]|nr:hypothetical protein BGW39_008633 [Mortierella sp. 14UC]
MPTNKPRNARGQFMSSSSSNIYIDVAPPQSMETSSAIATNSTAAPVSSSSASKPDEEDIEMDAAHAPEDPAVTDADTSSSTSTVVERKRTRSVTRSEAGVGSTAGGPAMGIFPELNIRFFDGLSNSWRGGPHGASCGGRGSRGTSRGRGSRGRGSRGGGSRGGGGRGGRRGGGGAGGNRRNNDHNDNNGDNDNDATETDQEGDNDETTDEEVGVSKAGQKRKKKSAAAARRQDKGKAVAGRGTPETDTAAAKKKEKDDKNEKKERKKRRLTAQENVSSSPSSLHTTPTAPSSSSSASSTNLTTPGSSASTPVPPRGSSSSTSKGKRRKAKSTAAAPINVAALSAAMELAATAPTTNKRGRKPKPRFDVTGEEIPRSAPRPRNVHTAANVEEASSSDDNTSNNLTNNSNMLAYPSGSGSGSVSATGAVAQAARDNMEGVVSTCNTVNNNTGVGTFSSTNNVLANINSPMTSTAAAAAMLALDTAALIARSTPEEIAVAEYLAYGPVFRPNCNSSTLLQNPQLPPGPPGPPISTPWFTIITTTI